MNDTRNRHPSPTAAVVTVSRRASPEEGNRKVLPLSALDLVPLVEGGTSVAALRAATRLAEAVVLALIRF